MNKQFIASIIICFCAILVHADPIKAPATQSKFELLDKNETDSSYMMNDFLLTIKSDPLKLSEVSGKSIQQMKETFEKKKELLKWIGITDWNVSDIQMKDLDGGKLIKFSGTFKDSGDIKMSFVEAYKVKTDGTKIFLLTAEKEALTEVIFQKAIAVE